VGVVSIYIVELQV